MSKRTCTACERNIDSAAKLCPYCGANPESGEKVDTQALMQEVFRPREITTSESVLEYARQRQGVVIAVSVFVAFLILAALHQFATMRNTTAVSDAPAVPLSEVTDLTAKADEAAKKPLPKIEFQYDGRPDAMRTYIVEPNAPAAPTPVAPPAPPSVKERAASGNETRN